MERQSAVSSAKLNCEIAGSLHFLSEINKYISLNRANSLQFLFTRIIILMYTERRIGSEVSANILIIVEFLSMNRRTCM